MSATIAQGRSASLTDEAQGLPYQPPASVEQLLPPRPADFKPFFVLIENPTTGEQEHPYVHYIFADDGSEGLTDAALEAIDGHRQQQDKQGQPAADITMKERFVIVDLEADGKTIRAVTSLSEDWQAAKAKIENAPSWSTGAEGTERGLMLKIAAQGVAAEEGSPDPATKQKKKQTTASPQALEELARLYGEQMSALEQVLAGEATETHAPNSAHAAVTTVQQLIQPSSLTGECDDEGVGHDEIHGTG